MLGRPVFVVSVLLAGTALFRASTVGAGEPQVGLHRDRLFDSRVLLAQAAPEPVPGLAPASTPPNTKRAMLYSLLLPGLGEYYLGHRGRATGFFVAEGAIWTSFTAFSIEGNHRESLYKEFAQVNAGTASRDDSDFYRVIGNFVSSDGPFSANEGVRRQARVLFPNDRAAQESFYAENAYQGDDAWTWSNESAFERYKDMRSSSLHASQKADLALGLAVANRLLSIIDVGILGSRSGNSETASLHWQVLASREGPQLVVQRSF